LFALPQDCLAQVTNRSALESSPPRKCSHGIHVSPPQRVSSQLRPFLRISPLLARPMPLLLCGQMIVVTIRAQVTAATAGTWSRHQRSGSEPARMATRLGNIGGPATSRAEGAIRNTMRDSSSCGRSRSHKPRTAPANYDVRSSPLDAAFGV
jgi:hypothetical protein